MKLCIATIISFSSISAFAADRPPLKLTSLKPAKLSQRQLGRVSAKLITVGNEKVVDQLSTVIGDCASCARGIAVKGVLGIRLQGNSLESLKVVKRSTPGVHYRDCKQLEIERGGEYQCTFTFRDKTYTVKIESRSLRRAAH